MPDERPEAIGCLRFGICGLLGRAERRLGEAPARLLLADLHALGTGPRRSVLWRSPDPVS